MGRFIHYAFARHAGGDGAVGPADHAEEIADRVGVFIGSGIGGFEVIEREHNNLLQGGPRKMSPFFIPAAIVNMAAGQISIRYGAQRSHLRDCHGLRHQRQLHRRLGAHDSAWRRRCDDRRRR